MTKKWIALFVGLFVLVTVLVCVSAIRTNDQDETCITSSTGTYCE